MAGPLDPLPAMFSFKGLKCGHVLKPRGEPGNTELWGPPSPETVILQGGVQEPAFLTGPQGESLKLQSMGLQRVRHD